MKLKDIKDALQCLEAGMLDKGILNPRATMSIRIDDVFATLATEFKETTLGGKDFMSFRGETHLEALEKAGAFVRSLPSVEETVLRGYLTRVAKAVDFATENSIKDEFVEPLRKVTCAMTENLIEKMETDDA